MKKKFFVFTAILLVCSVFLAGSVYAEDVPNPLLQPCTVTEDGQATCAADIATSSDFSPSELKVVEGRVPYVLFHLETCPHCRDHIDFLERVIRPTYGDRLDIQIIEISDPANAALYREYAVARSVDAGSVPAAFVGNELILGYSSDEVTGQHIILAIERALSGETTDEVVVPFLGTIGAKSISLPFLSLVLGLLDGFNPCAMWVLIFLISLLLPMEDARKRWLLGSVFIITSGVSYFIFMAAWLELILFVGVALIVRLIIGSLAVGVGYVSLRDFWRNRHADGVVCKVSDMKTAKSAFHKLKGIVHRDNLWWALVGIVLLGFSINLVELACSAGFPALFTQILALADVSPIGRYSYMLLYIFFYMLDDMIVFGAAMLTLRVAGGSGGGKYVKYAQLISGLLMLLLGLMLIFRPEMLMFT